MARILERQKAIRLRKEGKSYSQIKEALGISKSTLHYWLRDFPLSQKRIRELRDNNPKRIENFRNTMRRKREARFEIVYQKAKRDIGKLSRRDIFIAGFFLYWAEGTKTASYTTSVANSDPSVLRFFISWLKLIGVDRKKLKLRLHLYEDMDVEKETRYWEKELEVPKSAFRRPYIKKTKQGRITYKGGFGHGTCNVIVDNRDTYEYVIMGLKYMRER